MRLAVLADLHGNLRALEAILRDAERRGADGVVHLGDLVDAHTDPRAAAGVARALEERGVPGVLGEGDLARLVEEQARVSEGQSSPVEAFLRTLPAQLAVEEGSLRLLFVHASPEGLEDVGLADLPDDDLSRYLERCGADVLAVGHTHRALARHAGGRLLLNPGSAGCPPRPECASVSYVLLDTSGGLAVSHVRLEIGVESREL
ncbi:MAG: metallophosphoesterase family protein [Deferrisomatales bacterium]